MVVVRSVPSDVPGGYAPGVPVFVRHGRKARTKGVREDCAVEGGPTDCGGRI